MIEILNGLIYALGVSLEAILLLLPNSPFEYVYSLDASWLNIINYFMPVTEMVGCLEAYVVSVGLYYTIRIPMRWMKAAGE